jgi:hypothetical protein
MNEFYPRASAWIKFLRQYGPIPQNENMYDESIRRSARRAGVDPLLFEHPVDTAVLEAIRSPEPTSVILTGTAGDGKTHICRRVWEEVGGDVSVWNADVTYLSTELPRLDTQSGPRRLHVITDLSAWAPQRGAKWASDKENLLQRFSASAFPEVSTDRTGVDEPADTDIFLIAANDGQLIESWHRLQATPAVLHARELMETMLVEDRKELPGGRLRFLNLSRSPSATLFERAVQAFVSHPAWESCRSLNAGPGEFFGPGCPIRHNLELLENPLLQARLTALFHLCDYSRIHIPIRQILLLLVNALLGHQDVRLVRDRLMRAEDVPNVIREGAVAKANLYSNIFGGNLTDSRRESTLIFDAFDRFGIGYETSNRIDNILIYGEADDTLRDYFDRFMAADEFYGADPTFRAAQREYIEGADEDEQRSADFLSALVAQRRGLFFKIPDDEEEELKLWELTVFRYAGEYLRRVVGSLGSGKRVGRPVISRLV